MKFNELHRNAALGSTIFDVMSKGSLLFHDFQCIDQFINYFDAISIIALHINSNAGDQIYHG